MAAASAAPRRKLPSARLLIIGGVTDRMAAVLWVMAILSNWTVSQRIWYTWRELSALERRQGATTS